MAYSINDKHGYLGAGPSVNGLREVKTLLEEYKDFPRLALQQLLEHGHTNMLPALSMECRNLAKKTTDASIKHTLSSISALAKRADEVLILES